MQAVTFCPAVQTSFHAPMVAGARRTIEREASKMPGWPVPWVAADQFTRAPSSSQDLGLARLLVMDHDLTLPSAPGDLTEVLERARRGSGAERLELVLEAWRIHPAPALAALARRIEATLPTADLALPKKKGDQERRWMALAASEDPRALFAAPWPARWREAQLRMRALYVLPRSPLLAAAALAFGMSDPLPYTSIASQAFWQALAWFVAGQGDVSQLAQLQAFERRVADFVGRTETPAADALARLAEAVPALPPDVNERIEELLRQTPAPARPAFVLAELSLASPEERLVAMDAMLEAGDPRGEFISIQERLASGQCTPELLERERALLLRHAETWCPPPLWYGSCVFRRGVPAEGYLQYRSARELLSYRGAKLLETVERLFVDWCVMGRIRGEPIAEVARALPALRALWTVDAAAVALAKGPPTVIEHLGFEGHTALSLDGPGLPELRRVDVGQWHPSWLDHDWMTRIENIGVRDVEHWASLRTLVPDRTITLLQALDPIDRTTFSGAWELQARGDRIVPVPRAGATGADLRLALSRISEVDRQKVLPPPPPEAVAALGMSHDAAR